MDISRSDAERAADDSGGDAVVREANARPTPATVGAPPPWPPCAARRRTADAQDGTDHGPHAGNVPDTLFAIFEGQPAARPYAIHDEPSLRYAYQNCGGRPDWGAPMFVAIGDVGAAHCGPPRGAIQS